MLIKYQNNVYSYFIKVRKNTKFFLKNDVRTKIRPKKSTCWWSDFAWRDYIKDEKSYTILALNIIFKIFFFNISQNHSISYIFGYSFFLSPSSKQLHIELQQIEWWMIITLTYEWPTCQPKYKRNWFIYSQTHITI